MTKRKIDIRAYESRSPFIWVVNNIKLPKNAKWDFSTRRWQIDVLDDDSLEVVAMKPTQVGFTTIALCKQLHFAVTHDVRTMYTLPRQDDVTDLVNARLQEMIDNSPALAHLVGDLNNVRAKKIGNSFMHFMESSVMPRMLDVDHLVNDEVDLSNQDYLEQYVARLDASEYGYRYRFSTPTIHDFGIHAMYEQSDKKEWFVKCPACNREQVLRWEKHVIHKGNDTWYACEFCGKELTPDVIANGRWQATAVSPTGVSGYHISQMMVPYVSPSKLWTSYTTMSARNFYNLRLGEPYTSTTGSISKSAVINNCFASKHPRALSGQGYFLGADQGNEIHVAVGRYEDDKLKIVHLEVIPFEAGFERLEQLIELFGVRTAVIDALPNRHSAFRVAQKYSGRVWLAFYSDPGAVYKMYPKDSKVNISKTDSYDKLQEDISEGHLQFYGKPEMMDSEVRAAVNHLSNMRRDEMSRKSRLGGERLVSIWRNAGPDHYADAINYLNIAADIGHSSSSGLTVVEIGAAAKEELDREADVLPINPYARRMSLSSRFKRAKSRKYQF